MMQMQHLKIQIGLVFNSVNHGRSVGKGDESQIYKQTSHGEKAHIIQNNV